MLTKYEAAGNMFNENIHKSHCRAFSWSFSFVHFHNIFEHDHSFIYNHLFISLFVD